MSTGTRDGLALATGSIAAGLLAYVVFAVTTRGLSADDAAPVSVLWSYWAIAGAALTFPLQHWITRTVPIHGEAAVRRAAGRLAGTVLLLSTAMTIVAWAAREPMFGRDDPWFPVMVGMVTVGTALVGFTRGMLSARGRFVGLAASMVAENAIRCIAAGVLFTAEVRSAVGYGTCLLVGHLVVVLWPSAFWISAAGEAGRVSPFAFLAGAGFGQLAGQVVLTSGPVLLALAHGSPAQVTALFAALALFRAPYMVALGVLPQLTSRVTALVLARDARALGRLTAAAVGVTAVAVPTAALLAARLGPDLLQLVFGPEIRFRATAAALVAAGCTVAVANLVLMVFAMAQDRPAIIVRSWAAALAAGLLVLVLLADVPPLDRVVWSFVVAEVAAFAALLVANGMGRRSLRRPSAL